MPQSRSEDSKKGPPMFWWLLANILAIAFAVSSWMICLNLFRDPTNPTSYKLMMMAKRLTPLESYEVYKTPTPQQTNDALQLEAQLQSYTPRDLKALNQEVLRAYITNYHKPKFLVYVTGNFRILEARALTPDDFTPSGVAVKAQALIPNENGNDEILYPVFIECIFPSEDGKPEDFQVGNTIMLKKQQNSAAIIHVGITEYEEQNALYLSLAHLVSGKYETESENTFTITPPAKLNLEAALPIFP